MVDRYVLPFLSLPNHVKKEWWLYSGKKSQTEKKLMNYLLIQFIWCVCNAIHWHKHNWLSQVWKCVEICDRNEFKHTHVHTVHSCVLFYHISNAECWINTFYCRIQSICRWTNPFVDGIHKRMLIDYQLKTRVLSSKASSPSHKHKTYLSIPESPNVSKYTRWNAYTHEHTYMNMLPHTITTCIQDQTNTMYSIIVELTCKFDHDTNNIYVWIIENEYGTYVRNNILRQHFFEVHKSKQCFFLFFSKCCE